jgi:hypothetical protein
MTAVAFNHPTRALAFWVLVIWIAAFLLWPGSRD